MGMVRTRQLGFEPYARNHSESPTPDFQLLPESGQALSFE